MSIKLIASDLDGTLLTDCKELSPKTREVLDLAVQHGIYCTGNGQIFLFHTGNDPKLSGSGVCDHG